MPSVKLNKLSPVLVVDAIEPCLSFWVDRLGFTLRLKTNDGVKGARVNFLREVATPQDTRAVLVEMVRQAKAGG